MGVNVKQLVPALAIHPGEILLDELKARNIKQNEFASLIGYEATQLNEIIKGKRDINAEFALLIGKALEIDPEYWMRLQTQHDLDKVRIEDKNQQRLEAISVWAMYKDLIPGPYLKKIGWINGDPIEDIPRIKDLYQIKTVEELPAIYADGRFRKSTKLDADVLNLVTWTKVVAYKAKELEVKKFNNSKKEELVEKLKKVLKQNKKTVFKVESLLNEYGIKLIIEERPDKCPVDAYSFWSNGKPAIGMTLRHSRIDNFAFNLFHELGHVYLHLVNDNTVDFIDLEKDSTNYKNNKEEKEADQFASETLVQKGDWIEFSKPHVRYTDTTIKAFAKKQNVHPAVILGKLGHEMGLYPRTKISKDLN